MSGGGGGGEERKSTTIPHWKTLLVDHDDNYRKHDAYKKIKTASNVITPPPASFGANYQSVIVLLAIMTAIVFWVVFEYPKFEKCQLKINKQQMRLTMITISTACNEERELFEEHLNCPAIQQDSQLSPIPLIVSCWVKDNVLYELFSTVYNILTFNSYYSWIFIFVLIIYPLVWMRYHFAKIEKLNVLNQFSQLLFGMNGAAAVTPKLKGKKKGHHRHTIANIRPLAIDGRTRIEEIME